MRGAGRVPWAIRAGHVAAGLSRLGRRGTGMVIGGRVMLKLAPDAVRVLARGRRVVLLSGTNGKTTTTALLTAALRSDGPVASNADGANTPAGIVAALADGQADTVVLEVDEAWLGWAVRETAPRAVVLLNLSRDQLDRHHEVLGLAGKWRQALADVPVVVANADDPNVVWSAGSAPNVVWVAGGLWWEQDSAACPSCGRHLERAGGKWSCECGLSRPEPSWWVEDEELVHAGAERVPLRLGVPGRFNLRNAAMACAAAAQLGVPVADAAAGLGSVGHVGDRYATRRVGDHELRLVLAKNPAGWLEALRLVEPTSTPVVVAFNANGVDGRDPSWLYDVSFAALRERPVVVIGQRATDMGVRLRHDDVGFAVSGRSVLGALDSLPPGPVDVLANYTAFQQVRKELSDAR